MEGNKAKLFNVPDKDVGKIVQGYVLVKATAISCEKNSEGTWTIKAIIPPNADHAD